MNFVLSIPFVAVYKAWVNCCLAQFGDKKTINDLAGDLKDGVVFCQLIKLTTGYEIAQCQQVNNVPQTHQAVQINDVPQTHHAVQVNDVPQTHQAVQCVIDYMKGKGIDLCCQVEDVTSGKLKFILDILWLIILHFEIHSAKYNVTPADRVNAAVNAPSNCGQVSLLWTCYWRLSKKQFTSTGYRAAYQRTVNLGKRFLLEWCCTEIPNTAIDPRGPFLDFLQDGVLLTKLITKYCPVDGISPSKFTDKDSFLKVLKAAEDRLGIPRKILSSSGILDDNTFDEYAVIIYMAVLRRMVKRDSN
ncbi:hypothetical protein OS493_029473 [Desmophyllum pertusum]|uniref:Calponin-homology (CH) domain-containing protein n=1 Tax=Desmophyllum pertusum TaxID=174260 RepID=A0A9W9Y8W9_9CNID|nr:hypothetical protein OS493_029473 [Desmophyllum pertusum]